jgi:hypothetical protein
MSGPLDKPTVELERPPSWAISMVEQVSEMRAIVLKTNDQVIELGQRMTAAEMRILNAESRASTNSERAKSTSEIDLKQDAVLGLLTSRVDELAKSNVVVAEGVAKLVRVSEHPIVRRIGYAIGLSILGYLATKGWVIR